MYSFLPTLVDVTNFFTHTLMTSLIFFPTLLDVTNLFTHALMTSLIFFPTLLDVTNLFTHTLMRHNSNQISAYSLLPTEIQTWSTTSQV